jgi:hypothetical protein
MNRLVALTALILVSLIVPTSIYALQSQPVIDPKDIALNFIRDAPTFSFDGIATTLRVVDDVDLKSNPVQHLVTLTFTCLHSGYGDRTGKPTLQVLTPHTAMITVVEGKVTSAVLDDRWNELNQELIPQTKEIVTKIALDWLRGSPTFRFDGLKESLKVVEVWQAQTFAYPSFWQVTIEFDSLHEGYGDRAGQVLAKVITHHSIRIHVTEGVVTMAVIDEKWDELKQSMLPSTHTKEEAEQIALQWLYGSPTFMFDGVKDTVKVLRIDTLRMPNAYEVYIGFICSYPGYGDRTGHVTLGHSQQHIIRIMVHEGLVTRAIIDEFWDEINQKMLNVDEDQVTSPESARDYLVAYLIKTYNLGYTIPLGWVEEDLTPQQTVGISVTRYTSGPWVITVKYPVVLKPTYSVSITYGGSLPFTWKGTVGVDGVITTESTNLKQPSDQQQIIGPVEVRDICIAYILRNHADVKAEPPTEWSIKNLVPDGIVGITKIKYTGDGWEVVVSGPVVWKPTYNVEVHYTDSGAFKWIGTLPQGGPVQELAFNK